MKVPKSRNPIAKAVGRVNKPKVHKPYKGKGSYNRKGHSELSECPFYLPGT